MTRPVVASIDLLALRQNLQIVRRAAPGSRLWAVVKANAYGHGVARVWSALSAADGFALLNLEEAILLREQGWKGPILLLEVPMSIQYKHSAWMNSVKQGYDRLRGKVRSPSVHWLRPMGGNVETMKKVVEQTLTQGNDYVEYMLHSSEYMPGGSPKIGRASCRERVYVLV